MTKPIRVLMVDDEKRFRETTRKILAGKGFETILAEDGPGAIKSLDQDPSVVILDIKMPGMDGHEVLEEIQKIRPSLPVIMLTGHGDQASAEQAKSQGAFDYLSKPCDIEILAEKIREACHEDGHITRREEPTVGAVMIPIEAYTTIAEDRTVADAVAGLKHSFVSLLATSRLMETGHRSVLVMNPKGVIIGILTIRDLLEAVLPGYLTSSKPSTADSIQYSPMFWSGMFRNGTKALGVLPISDIMSPSPLSIDAGASLMEAAYLMMSNNHRRLLVVRNGVHVGVIREQDLFFEMERILKPAE